MFRLPILILAWALSARATTRIEPFAGISERRKKSADDDNVWCLSIENHDDTDEASPAHRDEF